MGGGGWGAASRPGPTSHGQMAQVEGSGPLCGMMAGSLEGCRSVHVYIPTYICSRYGVPYHTLLRTVRDDMAAVGFAR